MAYPTPLPASVVTATPVNSPSTVTARALTCRAATGSQVCGRLPSALSGLARTRGLPCATWASSCVGPGKLKTTRPSCAASVTLRRCTSKTAAGVLLAAASPTMNGDQARIPTPTGEPGVSYSTSSTG